jgi:hypothetical protein
MYLDMPPNTLPQRQQKALQQNDDLYVTIRGVVYSEVVGSQEYDQTRSHEINDEPRHTCITTLHRLVEINLCQPQPCSRGPQRQMSDKEVQEESS